VDSRDALLKAAADVRLRAYAPYSNYLVGAALLDDKDQIHVGCNVENLSYGGTICAERSAVTRMIADGGTQLKAVAVVTRDGGAPCGICRQVLVEFTNDPSGVPVFMAKADALDQSEAHSLAELAPFAFNSSEVGRTDPQR
jgi:cytidine deaminase